MKLDAAFGALIALSTIISCRSSDPSSVKDVLLMSKTGAMLFYREGENIVIKACKEPVTISSPASQSCELREGSSIQTVAQEDFRKDLVQALKLQVSDPKVQAEVEKIGKEDAAQAAARAKEQQAAERAQLKADIAAIRELLGNADPKKAASLSRVLAQLETNLAKEMVITPKEVDPVNAAVSRVIEDLIAKPEVTILTSSTGGFFFALLESYITRDLVTQTDAPLGISFVSIQPGSFTMGSPTEEAERDSDEIPHPVTLTRGFLMSRDEITQGQWKAVMGHNPSYFKLSDDHPAETMGWADAQAFVMKLNGGSARCGDTTTAAGFEKARVTPGCYRLATEAEWEYAARAGTKTPFYTGLNITTAQANYDGNYPYAGNTKGIYRRKTVPVQELDATNPWGLRHMSGNVWEWVQDAYAAYDPKAQTDPVVHQEEINRVLRDGTWRSYLESWVVHQGSVGRVLRGGSGSNRARLLRSADRNFADFAYSNIGVRLVRTLP